MLILGDEVSTGSGSDRVARIAGSKLSAMVNPVATAPGTDFIAQNQRDMISGLLTRDYADRNRYRNWKIEC